MSDTRKLNNGLPRLPDDIIETVRQYMDEDEDRRWKIGDYLTDVVVELAPMYQAAGIRHPRSVIFRQIAGMIGCDTSTLRDRQNMSEFFTPPIRQELSPLSWSQLRACKSAGIYWREYAEWALANLPAPVAVIRARVKHNGHLPPAWEGRWARVLELCGALADDKQAPDEVRRLAGVVLGGTS